MSDIEELLERAVAGEEFGPPGPSLYAAAAARARRRTLARATAATAAVGVLAGAGALGSGMLRQSRPDPPLAVAAAEAPACVRRQLAEVNALVRTGRYSAVVADIPQQKVLLTHGVSSGYGWDRADLVEVVHDLPGLTPAGRFRLWEGITPDDNPAPGRHLLVLSLDNSPKVPGGNYGTPVWGVVWRAHFPVTGGDVTVRCEDGTAARVPWTDAATTWLGPSAPVPAEPATPARPATPSPAQTAKP